VSKLTIESNPLDFQFVKHCVNYVRLETRLEQLRHNLREVYGAHCRATTNRYSSLLSPRLSFQQSHER